MTKSEKLNLSTFIIVAGFVVSVIFHYVRGGFYDMTTPLDSFLPPPPRNHWGDFFGPHDQWGRLHFMGEGVIFSYPPASYLLFSPFFIDRYPQRAILFFLLFFFVFHFAVTYFFTKVADKLETTRNVFVFTLACYPVLFFGFTGNLEGILYLCLMAFAIFYSKGKDHWAALFLGAAVGAKPFPGIFFILLLVDKKYKATAVTMSWALFFNCLALGIFPGGFQDGFADYLKRFMVSLDAYKQMTVGINPPVLYEHSLSVLIRVLFHGLLPPIETFVKIYSAIIVGIAGLAAYVVYKEKTFWKRLTILVCCMNLLPFTSIDYKLLHLLVPFFFFFNDEKKDKLDFTFCILFSLTMCPTGWVFPFKEWVEPYKDWFRTVSTVLNPTLMLLMMYYISRPYLGRSGGKGLIRA